jgi:hypothetical protein
MRTLADVGASRLGIAGTIASLGVTP